MNSTYGRLSTPAASSIKLEASMGDEGSKPHRGSLTSEDEHPDGRPYYGKCQYKTGKCFNERTLKRNGEVHSLCEEHRIKQNLIQRRSDRKYQTVHAIRRRERSQRRAVLKKQVSMAVAQQLFYEHQQQKTLGVQLATSGPHQGLPPRASLAHASGTTMGSLANAHPAPASVASLVPPLTNPGSFLASAAEGLASPILSYTTPSAFGRELSTDDDEHEHDEQDRDEDANDKRKPEDGSPTGMDEFTPDAFLSLCCSDESEPFGAAPVLSARSERELWSEADIDFLQTLLLA